MKLRKLEQRKSYLEERKRRAARAEKNLKFFFRKRVSWGGGRGFRVKKKRGKKYGSSRNVKKRIRCRVGAGSSTTNVGRKNKRKGETKRNLAHKHFRRLPRSGGDTTKGEKNALGYHKKGEKINSTFRDKERRRGNQVYKVKSHGVKRIDRKKKKRKTGRGQEAVNTPDST